MNVPSCPLGTRFLLSTPVSAFENNNWYGKFVSVTQGYEKASPSEKVTALIGEFRSDVLL